MISALTKAVQDVVKIIEIIVAVLHDGPVAHGVVEPAVRVRHCTRTGRGDKGPEGGWSQRGRSPRHRSQRSSEPRSDPEAPSRPGEASCPALLLRSLARGGPGSSHLLGAGGSPQACPPPPLIHVHFAFLCCQLSLLPLGYPWWATLLGGERGAALPLGAPGLGFAPEVGGWLGSEAGEGKAPRRASCSTWPAFEQAVVAPVLRADLLLPFRSFVTELLTSALRCLRVPLSATRAPGSAFRGHGLSPLAGHAASGARRGSGGRAKQRPWWFRRARRRVTPCHGLLVLSSA